MSVSRSRASGLQRREVARVRREVVACRGDHAEREREIETRDRVQGQGALMVRVRRGAEALVGVRVRCGAEVLVGVRARCCGGPAGGEGVERVADVRVCGGCVEDVWPLHTSPSPAGGEGVQRVANVGADVEVDQLAGRRAGGARSVIGHR